MAHLPEAERSNALRRLIKAWQQGGTLVLDPGLKDRAFILSLPQGIRSLWSAAISGGVLPKIESKDVDPVALNRRAEEQIERHKIKVCGLDGATADALCCATETVTKRAATTWEYELCRADNLDITEAHKYVNEKWIALPDSRTSADDIWLRYFAGPVANAEHMSVVDRYLVPNHLDKQQAHETALETLFKRLRAAQDGRLKTITIYSGRHCMSENGPAVSDFELKQRISAVVGTALSARGARVAIRLCDDGVFKTHAHDRYFRFDGCIVLVGKGAAIIRGAKHATGCTVKTEWHSKALFQRNVESMLDKNAILRMEL